LPCWANDVYLLVNWRVLYQISGKSQGEFSRHSLVARRSMLQNPCGAADRPKMLLFPEAAMRNISITQPLRGEVSKKDGRTGGRNSKPLDAAQGELLRNPEVLQKMGGCPYFLIPIFSGAVMLRRLSFT
jgi:hypothetical protein